MLALAPQDFQRVDQGKRSDLAKAAARLGTSYALARLRENPYWNGGDDDEVVVDTPNLYVVEHRGNVVGLIKGSQTPQTQFRIRFNHQDGDGGVDGLRDPEGQMNLDLEELSYNNLFHSTPIAAINQAHDFEISTEDGQIIPDRRILLSVEGRAGTDIEGLPRERINGRLMGGRTSRRVLQSIFAPTDMVYDEIVPEGVALAAGGFRSVLSPRQGYRRNAGASTSVLVDSMLRFIDGDTVNNSIRSKGGVDILMGSHPSQNFVPGDAGTVARGAGESFQARLPAGHADFAPDEEASDEPFYQIPLDEVRRPPAGSPTMKAGVYSYHQDTDSFQYYDMDYIEFVDAMNSPTPPLGQPAVFPANVTISGQEVFGRGLSGNREKLYDQKKLFVTGDLNIEGTTRGTRDFTLIPRGGAIENSFDPPAAHKFSRIPLPAGVQDDVTPQQLKLVCVARQDQPESTVYCSGKVMVAAQVRLPGSAIVSERSIRLLGATTGEASDGGEQAISLYARADIHISTFNEYWTRRLAANGRKDIFNNAHIRGILYSFRNISIDAGLPDWSDGSIRADAWGDIQIRGTMVAYGGDPEGAPGNAIANRQNPEIGNIRLLGHRIHLLFDPSYLAGLTSPRVKNADFQVLTSVWR